MLSRGRSSDAQPALSAISVSPPMFAIQRSHAPVVSSSSHTPQACASGIVDQPLDEGAEEAAQIGMRDQQVERELHGVALDRGHALGALPIVAQRLERRGQLRDLELGRQRFAKRGRLWCVGGCRHVPIMKDRAAPATRPGGRPAGRPFGRCRSAPDGRCRPDAFGGPSPRHSAGLWAAPPRGILRACSRMLHAFNRPFVSLSAAQRSQAP